MSATIKEDDRFNVVLMNPPYGGSEKEGVNINYVYEIFKEEQMKNP